MKHSNGKFPLNKSDEEDFRGPLAPSAWSFLETPTRSGSYSALLTSGYFYDLGRCLAFRILFFFFLAAIKLPLQLGTRGIFGLSFPSTSLTISRVPSEWQKMKWSPKWSVCSDRELCVGSPWRHWWVQSWEAEWQASHLYRAFASIQDARKTGTNLTRESTNREEQSTYPAQDWIVLLVKKNEEKRLWSVDGEMLDRRTSLTFMVLILGTRRSCK